MDTLQAAKALQDAGFDQTQAEALVHTIGNAVDNNVASKTDVAELRAEFHEFRAETRAEFDKSRAETRAQNDRLRAEMYRALAFQTIAIVGAMLAFLKLL